MFDLAPWEIGMYLGMIAVGFMLLGLAAAIVAGIVDDTANAVAGYVARRRRARFTRTHTNHLNHTKSPE